jgi:hypothetical protein
MMGYLYIYLFGWLVSFIVFVSHYSKPGVVVASFAAAFWPVVVSVKILQKFI